MIRTIKKIKDDINNNNNAADVRIGITTKGRKKKKYIATPYYKARRLRKNSLLGQNINEPHWPGGRTDYEIDRDQILFNTNFARLARKTQVFIGQGNILYRNRLMHTLEVVQFSRSVAKKNNLNYDLVEAIAYGHDIGHTPFGHAGEDALNQCIFEYYIRNNLNLENPSNIELGRGDDNDSRRDRIVWTLVQSLVGRYPDRVDRNELLDKSTIEELAGKDLFNKLEKNNIIKIDNKCFLKHPLDWEWSDEKKNKIIIEFWLQNENQEFFLHNIHALRVLLCDSSKKMKDITYQTAWGILAHSGRKYNIFKCYLLDGKYIELKNKRDQTPESFLVQHSDDICFANSDLEDARMSNIIDSFESLSDEQQRTIWNLAENNPSVLNDWPKASQRLQFLETGFKFTSKRQPSYDYVDRVENARKIIKLLVYPVLIPRQLSAKRIIRDLFWFYCSYNKYTSRRDVETAAWNQMKDYFINSKRNDEWEKQSRERVAVDFIAHMTDDDAIATHNALFAPDQRHWVRHFYRKKADS